MHLPIPVAALVVLVGPSGAGKSTFAARHFTRTEIVSSDECRALVSDDDGNQSATPAAFRLLHAIVRERLRAGRIAVVDATNVKPASRKPLVAIARRHARPAVAIVFAVPLDVCLSRIDLRPDRIVPIDAIRLQHAQLATSLSRLEDEGFDAIHLLRTAAEADTVTIGRAPQ